MQIRPNASIKFTKGIFRYIAGQAKSEENVKLSTPTTTLTIRGTKFIVQVADDGSTIVSVLDGVVDIQPCGPGKPTRATSGYELPRLADLRGVADRGCAYRCRHAHRL